MNSIIKDKMDLINVDDDINLTFLDDYPEININKNETTEFQKAIINELKMALFYSFIYVVALLFCLTTGTVIVLKRREPIIN